MTPNRESIEEAQRELRRSAKQAHAERVTDLIGRLLSALAGESQSVVRDALTMAASTHNLRVVSAERPAPPTIVRERTSKVAPPAISRKPPPSTRHPELIRLEVQRKELAQALSSGTGPSDLLGRIHLMDRQIKAFKVLAKSGSLEASKLPPPGSFDLSKWYQDSGLFEGVPLPPDDRQPGNGEGPSAGNSSPAAQ